MENIYLFPFTDYWWFYLGFTAFVLLMLALDLGVFHREAHEVSFKESLTWSIIWISLALLFNFLFYAYAVWKFSTDPLLLAIPGFDPAAAARQVGLEFLTGYIVEKTLAVDNIFVFVVVFGFFSVPIKYQHRVLFFGILGALVFRIIFIAMGSLLLQYHWVVIVFGIFLILTGLKILFAPEKPIDPERNPVIRLFRSIFPVTHTFEGHRFFLRKEGVLYATPLMVTLLFIEVSDIIFAVDSVPAIFAITKEPLIVFTSNIFAILGLRAMYFMLAGIIHKFRYLKYGLGIVLLFVGLKMSWLNQMFGGKFPISWSLILILTVITISILISLFKKDKGEKNAMPNM
ncbi:MAG TPA: TerC family protein [Ignavibacteriales bacterium]|nr:TerC family protein [Ignavibacteriales bacterium]